MCCRFGFGEKAKQYIDKISSVTTEKVTGMKDIRPSDQSPVIFSSNHVNKVQKMRWGFPSRMSGQLLINARAETVFEKNTFKDSIFERRCILAADCFYEWDSLKNLVTFTVPGQEVILLGGIYKFFNDGFRFTVLTTAANEDMMPVHDRMPVIIQENLAEEWLNDPSQTRPILDMPSPRLSYSRNYDQLSLF